MDYFILPSQTNIYPCDGKTMQVSSLAVVSPVVMWLKAHGKTDSKKQNQAIFYSAMGEFL